MSPSPAPIPLFEPRLRGNEWRYVKDCLDTGWVSSVGAYVRRFEEETARRLGFQHAVAAVNGTSALHAALLVSGVGPGDEVILPSVTFIAPANAVRYVGAHPVLMDAEPDYFQIDVEKTLDFLKKECRWSRGALRNKSSGRRVRALMPVDVLGHPADVRPLREAAKKYGLLLLQDASESLGSRYRGGPTGRGADIACLSFNGNKLVTTGGGGMLLTDDAAWAAKARHLTTQAKTDPIEYIHDEVGYNYRLTNVLAALGLAQLEQLDGFVTRKRRAAARYAKALRGIQGLTPMREAPWARGTYWMYTIRVDEKRYGLDARTLLRRLARRGIMTRPIWQPLHLSKAHKGAQSYRCESAELLYREALSLPSSVALSDAQQDRIVTALRS
ncbi:MAG: LegC family aminotransferase [Elusimicrobia bacterium]|nr:LegC family aminotransferase [Elusimicrobiota bacterium]